MFTIFCINLIHTRNLVLSTEEQALINEPFLIINLAALLQNTFQQDPLSKLVEQCNRLAADRPPRAQLSEAFDVAGQKHMQALKKPGEHHHPLPISFPSPMTAPAIKLEASPYPASADTSSAAATGYGLVKLTIHYKGGFLKLKNFILESFMKLCE